MRFSVLTIGFLAVIGCAASDSSSTAGLELRTDRPRYLAIGNQAQEDAQWTFAIVATLKNTSDVAVYLDHCGGTGNYPPMFSVERVGDGPSPFDPIWACGGPLHLLVLAAHSQRVDTLAIRGPNEFGTGIPAPRPDGVFELSYYAYPCDAAEDASLCDRLPSPRVRFEVNSTP